MALPSFAFGPGFAAKTPAEAARNRAVYEQLASRGSAPKNLGEGLNRVGEVLLARSMMDRATKGEEEGRAHVSELMTGLQDGADMNELMGVMTDPWASENPGLSAVSQSLMQRELQKQDPAFQLDLDLKRAQLADAQQPDPIPAPETDEMKVTLPGGGTATQKLQFNGKTGAWDPMGEPVPDVPPGPNIDVESKLRTEYQGGQGYKDFSEQERAYQRVLDSARDPSAAGDLALIFNYMKILDPGSVVRESEFATAAASGSFGEQIQAAANKVISGERLSDEMRRDFVARAGDLYKGASDLFESGNQRYGGIATQYGVDPARIIRGAAKIGVLDPEFNIDEYLAPDGSQTKPLPVTSDADYDALPSGAIFEAPDGSIRKKP